MNINEARIGNFARTKKGELVMVCHIEEKAVIYRKHRLKTKGPKIDDQKSVQDIPLDRSWLFCFGFLIAQMENAPVGVTYWVKDGFCFYEASGHFYIKVGEMIGGKNMALEFDYVHELQNIFGFMGTELKYTKPKGGMTNILKNLN